MKDLQGQRFNELTVLERSGSSRQGSATWLCQCDCGNTTTLSSDHLTRKRNPVKTCGCKRVRRGKDHAQWTGVGDISGNWWYNHIKRELFGKYNRHRLEVTLTIEEAWQLYLDQDRSCALSGLGITIGDSPCDKASLDRIDNGKGYTLENVQWVHKDINFMKRSHSQEYFIWLCGLVHVHNR